MTNLPSKALYMDLETALHRAKALFRVICDLSSYVGVDNSDTVSELASLGEAIIKDQLVEDNKEDPPQEAEV